MHNSEEAFRTIYGKMLEETRRNYNLFVKNAVSTAKARYYLNFLPYYLMLPPRYAFFGGDTRYDKLYTNQLNLYKHGRVVWGHLVQANGELFSKGRRNLPAAFIYSLDPIVDSHPDILAKAATILFETKGDISRNERTEFAKISYILTDERIHVWKLPVPLSATEGVQCYYLSNMVFRKHLPGRMLNGNLFPFLVCPEKTDVGFILPSRLWSKEFIERCW